MRSALYLLISVTIASASYCGQAAIPFTFQSLRSGQPVLGCARPKCFGWTANGTRADDTARFYKINGKEDGYLRRSDVVLRAAARADFQPQLAKCDQDYRKASCEVGEWVGGIAPLPDAHSDNFEIKCCAYPLLQDTEDKGVAPIKPGQVYIGGEVVEGSKLVAFDYISDVTKHIFPNNTILYEVSVRRMACFDAEPAPSPEPVVSNNAVVQNLDGDVRVRQDAINQAVQGVPQPQTSYGVQDQNKIAQYGVQQTQTFQQQQLPQTQQVVAQPQTFQQQLPQIPGFQTQFPGFQQVPQAFQQLPQGYQQPGAGYPTFQQYPQWFPTNVPQAPQALPGQQPQLGQTQLGAQQMVQPGQVPLATMAPLNLPKLEDLPQIQIPSVEQVEEVIPPMQKAILTNIAKFFGVL